MKKIISFALSLMMVMTIATPCMAATITKDTDQSGSTVIKTSTKTAADTDAATYTVTIPADQTYYWNTTTAQDVSYYVTSQLPYGATLAVAVTGSGQMSDSVNAANTQKLSYTMTGGSSASFGALNSNVKHDVNVTISGWSSVPISEYSDTLTYAVTYTA